MKLNEIDRREQLNRELKQLQKDAQKSRERTRNVKRRRKPLNPSQDIIDQDPSLDPELRRNTLLANFERELNDLVYEYWHTADLFGDANSPGVLTQLEKVLRDATFNPHGISK